MIQMLLLYSYYLTKALDENGRKLFNAGEIDVLKNEVKDSDLQSLMLAVIKRRRGSNRPKRLVAELKKDNLMIITIWNSKRIR